MKNLTAKQIASVKDIQKNGVGRVHGNTKYIGGIPVEEAKEIVYKRGKRSLQKNVNDSELSVFDRVRDILAYYCAKAKNSPYFKILVAGNKNIYLASPYYGHADYNKSVVMPNTPKNQIIMKLVNALLYKLNPK